jgi:hypothetical protein
MRAFIGAFLRIVKRNQTSIPDGGSFGLEARTAKSALWLRGQAWIPALRRAQGKLSAGMTAPRAGRIFLITLPALIAAAPLDAADLKPATTAAYERYVQAAEAQIARRRAGDSALYIENLPAAERQRALAQIRRDEIYVQPMEVRDADGKEIEIPDGMVHNWLGAAFIPRATLEQTMNVLFNYERYKYIFKREVVGSRLLSRSDGDMKVNLRLQKKTSLVSVTYDCDYDVQYKHLDEHHAFSHTHAIRIQQVENAGRPDERLDPAGHDSGYLWGSSTFWEAEEVSDGVIVEWQVISLSRPIPFLVRWIVRPLIAHLAHETVTDMLSNTRKAVEASLESQKRDVQRPAPAEP